MAITRAEREAIENYKRSVAAYKNALKYRGDHTNASVHVLAQTCVAMRKIMIETIDRVSERRIREP
jgi:hypothetical protein